METPLALVDGRLDVRLDEFPSVWLLTVPGASARPEVQEFELDPLIDEGLLVPVNMQMDTSPWVRIVVDGELTESERTDALGSVTWWLDARDGVVALGYGLNPVLDEWSNDEDHAFIAVPPGIYAVDVYWYVGPNALVEWEIKRSGEEPDAYWRRTRGDEPMPEWAQRWADPVIEGDNVIDFVAHLRRVDAAPSLTRPYSEAHPWFELEELTVPDRAPDGLAPSAHCYDLQPRDHV